MLRTIFVSNSLIDIVFFNLNETILPTNLVSWLILQFVGTGILRAIGNSKTPFYFLITANIVNITLDLIFVVIFKMGVVGAAIATVISQAVSARKGDFKFN